MNSTALPNNDHPIYFGVMLDCTLTYRQHIKSLKRKVNGRNGLRCLAGSSWGACTATICIGALALVYSTAEYISPVWCRSAHVPKLDSSLNDTMHIVIGCVCPMETTFLPVLTGTHYPTSAASHTSPILPMKPWRSWITYFTSKFLLLTRFPGSISDHTGLSLNMLPTSSVPSLTCTRCGTIMSITVHLPSGPLTLHPARHCHPVLTYRKSSG